MLPPVLVVHLHEASQDDKICFVGMLQGMQQLLCSGCASLLTALLWPLQGGDARRLGILPGRAPLLVADAHLQRSRRVKAFQVPYALCITM